MAAPDPAIRITEPASAGPKGTHHRGTLRAASAIALAAVATSLVPSGVAVQAAGVALPDVTGPAPVGRTEITLTDTARVDPFAADGHPRELAIWIWYPSVAGSTGAPAPFLPPTWASLVNGAGIVSVDLTAVQAGAIQDAPLDGHPPVVVLLPGLGQPVAAYTTLAEDLASRGWAVVGINPTGSTSVVVFPDGHVVPASPAGSIDPSLLSDVPGWYAAAERITTVWADDAAFVVAALAASPPPMGALDLGHVAYVGHSLGGAAAFQACADDAACAAAVDLDGTLWTDVRHTGLTAPNLLLRSDRGQTCDAFCAAAEVDLAVVEARSSATSAVIEGSRHMSFTDLGLLEPVAGTVDLGTVDPERMTVITRDLVASFLDEHARGAAAGTFTAALARIPEAR